MTEHIPKLQELLIADGIDEAEIQRIASEIESGQDLKEVLKSSAYIEKADINRYLSNLLDVPTIDLTLAHMNEMLNQTIGESVIKEHQVLCVTHDGEQYIVMPDPLNTEVIDQVKMSAGIELKVALCDADQMKETISSIFEEEEEDEFKIDEKGEEDDWGDSPLAEAVAGAGESGAPIVKIVDLILMDSCNKGASDIHIEPYEKKVRVRYRVDGALIDAFSIPKSQHGALLARIKIMSSLDITESRIPQDGRFKMRIGEKEVDYRVSILPTHFGGKIVLRLLDKSNLKVGISDLSFSQRNLERFEIAIKKPFGMIIVTGPTGSGKSTTLYSMLNELNTIEKNIITVEDPVEYQVKGITQVQARTEIGMTFASALKAILRQSPDVVMIGEIRDGETADIAVKAALTGQLVLSTLHTNDAAGAVVRLVDMGIEPFLVSSSLALVAAQRLCRRICDNCKVEVEYGPQELLELGFDTNVAELVKKPIFCKGKGCSKCGRTGLRGRVAITETLLVDNEIAELIEKGSSAADIKSLAISRGMLTLRTDALLKFAQGLIPVEEVLRTTASDER